MPKFNHASYFWMYIWLDYHALNSLTLHCCFEHAETFTLFWKFLPVVVHQCIIVRQMYTFITWERKCYSKIYYVPKMCKNLTSLVIYGHMLHPCDAILTSSFRYTHLYSHILSYINSCFLWHIHIHICIHTYMHIYIHVSIIYII